MVRLVVDWLLEEDLGYPFINNPVNVQPDLIMFETKDGIGTRTETQTIHPNDLTHLRFVMYQSDDRQFVLGAGLTQTPKYLYHLCIEKIGTTLQLIDKVLQIF